MSEIYCSYKGILYPADINDDKIEMTSDFNVKGFRK